MVESGRGSLAWWRHWVHWCWWRQRFCIKAAAVSKACFISGFQVVTRLGREIMWKMATLLYLFFLSSKLRSAMASCWKQLSCIGKYYVGDVCNDLGSRSREIWSTVFTFAILRQLIDFGDWRRTTFGGPFLTWLGGGCRLQGLFWMSAPN